MPRKTNIYTYMYHVTAYDLTRMKCVFFNIPSKYCFTNILVFISIYTKFKSTITEVIENI